MMDFIFGYQSSKIKPYLKMAAHRIEISKNKKSNLIKHHKKEIAALLRDNKEEKARIRVEHMIREDFTIEAMEIIQLMCDLVHERILYLSSEKNCPDDLIETVSTIIWATNRLDIPELQNIRKQLSFKYGNAFIKAAEENNCESKVNKRVFEKLSIKPPSMILVHRYMKEIAEENAVDWIPSQVFILFIYILLKK